MRKVVNINRMWAFSKESKDIPTSMPTNWVFLNLPHTWNALDGMDGGNDYYRGTCLYAKKLLKEELPESDEYYLEINGANSSAKVYYNGEKIAEHDGGYSTWRVKLPSLEYENLLVIAVDNSPNDYVYPQKADFTFYGGLYRDINIICVDKSHFDLSYFGGPGIHVKSMFSEKDGLVQVRTYPVSLGSEKVKISIFDQDGNLIEEKEGRDAEFAIKDVHLWKGLKDPYLYSAKAEIIRDGNVVDSVSTRFGVRTFSIDAERGFFLNGESYPLHGVSRHQDRWDKGNAISKADHEEDMDLICEVGANTIRLAHYQHDQYFYDLCDEKGMIVWAEIPYISGHMEKGMENTISQMKELVIQNYNHPSIVVWGLSNEITINGSTPSLLENHNKLNDLVHSLDDTRLTTIAVVSMCSIDDPYIKIPDVISYNHYFGWYGGDADQYGPWFDDFHKKYPSIPIGLSEYGAEALNWHSSNPQQGDYTEEYQALYHESIIKQMFSRPYIWSTHVWNMFDFGADARSEGGENGQNHKGLVTIDRKYKKDSFYIYKAYLSVDPFVHITSKRYVERVEDTLDIKIYSNLPEVELFQNGKSLGKKRSDDHIFIFKIENKGRSSLLAKAGEYEDEAEIIKVDSMNTSYVLQEKGAILNWFDITVKEGYFSLNDKIEDIIKKEDGKKALAPIFERLNRSSGKGMLSGGLSDDMMKMMRMFSVMRCISMASTLTGAPLDMSKEELLAINDELNKIQK